ncbi:class I SAM-dependent methyltransferase [Metabacillus idriensis]|uniref:class I SAM-dependent methyltransferase n=1 Tax=Metabacillus idriensis TaxID=324768 RepID=UPI0012B018AE|nr:class I SAM-dependent methyltransferase [Metabacillus idriensis]
MIIAEYVRLFKARSWMKRNMPFLYSWHAYVGYELDLFEIFKSPKTIDEVAAIHSLELELLERWVEVGVSIKYLKEVSRNRFKTSKSFMLPDSKKDPKSVGILLKEMMELHIPALLTYPAIMKTDERQTFDHEQHGTTVAKTSSLLEQLAYPKLIQLVKKNHIQSIVDVGCGHGGYLQKLSQELPEIKLTGIEINEEVADEAADRCMDIPNISITCMDVEEWRAESPADLIMMNNLLHYISPEKRVSLIQNLSICLSSSGMISIITPLRKPKHGKQFSSVFNSFFTAYDNLYALPTKKELSSIAEQSNMKLKGLKPIIREGGWYFATFVKKG